VVFRTIGNSAYRNSAINAGRTPMRPVIAIRKASSASEGIVCTTLTAPRASCPTRGTFAASTPSGTPTATDAASDANVSTRCSRVSFQKSPPSRVCQKLRRPSPRLPSPTEK